MSATPALRSNVWKLSLYRFLSEFWVIAPVLIPYYQSGGLSSTQVFVIQSIYVALAALFEIPSGYFADVIGRRTALTAGAVLLPAGLVVYALSNSFWGFVAAEALLAAAVSMRSGTDTALLYDTLTNLKARDHFSKKMGRVEMAARAGGAAAAVCGALLGLVHLKLPFLVNIATGSAMILIALGITEPRRGRESGHNPLLGILRTVRFVFTHRKILPVLAYWALLFGTGVTGYWAYVLYYQDLKIHPAMFGALIASFMIFSGIGSSQSHRMEKLIGHRASIILPLAIGACFLALGVLRTRLAVPLVFANGFLWGLAGPLLMNDLNSHTPSRVRATVVSVSNMAGGLVFAALSPLFGFLTDAAGLRTALAATGVFFLISGAWAVRSIFKSRAAEPEAP